MNPQPKASSALSWAMLFVAFSITLWSVSPTLAQASPAAEVVSTSIQGIVNVNEAGTEELMKVRGIGPSLAERIIAFRNEFGPFEQVEDLSQVRGIGEARLEKIRNQITL